MTGYDDQPRGGCECGAVAYEVAPGTPIHVYACHCRNCQTRSGSGFAEHALLPSAAFTCHGATVSFVRKGEDMEFEEVFCARCYTRLFNRNNMMPGMIFLRAGTLAFSDDLRPVAHIWTSRKQPWLNLSPDVPQFSESPTPEQFGAILGSVSQP